MSKLASLIPALNVLIGTLCGIAIATLWQPTPTATSPAALDPGLDAGVEGERLSAILSELRSIDDRLALPQVTSAPEASRTSYAREPVIDDDTTNPEIATLLQRCTTLIERLERASSSGRQSLAPAPASASRKGLAEQEGIGRDELEQFARGHYLWSYQQVLDRYGMPDKIWTRQDGGMTWNYQVEGRLEENDWQFRFSDGVIIAVDD